MREIILTLRNKAGLHARPAAIFVQKAKSFKSTIRIARTDRAVDAKSILSVLSLGANNGTVITLRADGEDEERAIAGLQELIESNMGEA